MDDAYEMLRRSKRDRESFSDAIRRVLGQKENIMGFAGALENMPELEAKTKKANAKAGNEWEKERVKEAAKRGYIG